MYKYTTFTDIYKKEKWKSRSWGVHPRKMPDELKLITATSFPYTSLEKEFLERNNVREIRVVRLNDLENMKDQLKFSKEDRAYIDKVINHLRSVAGLADVDYLKARFAWVEYNERA